MVEIKIPKCNNKCPLCCNDEGDLPVEMYEERGRKEALEEVLEMMHKRKLVLEEVFIKANKGSNELIRCDARLWELRHWELRLAELKLEAKGTK